MKFRKILVGCLLVSISIQSYAYETKEGKVSQISFNTPAASGRNVIIWLEGVSQMCNIPSNNETGYFNKADSPDTFNAFITAFTMAKASGSTVKVLTKQGAEGCMIDRVDLLNN